MRRVGCSAGEYRVSCPGTMYALTPGVFAANLTGKVTLGEQMSSAATTTLSSKGQVVIPEEIRIQLGLEPGAQFVVIADRDVVIFKVLAPPSLKDFAKLVGRARQVAKQTGMTRADIANSVQRVRRSR